MHITRSFCKANTCQAYQLFLYCSTAITWCYCQSAGMMFSGLGALFLLLNQSNDESWSNWLGAAWLIGLAGAAAMEAFLNFCLGCVFFSIGIYLGVFPKGVYTVHLNTKTEMVNTWDVMNTRLGQVLGEPISKQHQVGRFQIQFASPPLPSSRIYSQQALLW